MNTIELLGEEETFKNIVERKITELEDNKIDVIRDYAFYKYSTLTSVSFPVATSIGREAFRDCTGLTEVSIPVATSIGREAFQGCTGLTSVSFPVATSIGIYAFNRCTGLTSVSFPNVISIVSDVFENCSKLTEVSFPEVTSIGNSAFFYCSSLTSVSIPKATSIGSNAFQDCSSLASVSLPKATSIGEYAFSSCSSLTSVSFPVVTSISTGAFQSCYSLTEVSFPKATSIGSNAFSSCSKLTEVSIPVATSIGKNAFNYCSKLTSVSFPKATSIGDSAFENCGSLTSVSFPEATSIGSNAFYGCKSLTTIYVGINTSTVCTLSSTNAFDNCPNLTNIYVPESLVGKYKLATNWSTFASKIKVDIQPAECITLSITADNVAIGNATSTTVHYTAECTYTKNGILQEGTMVFTGEGTSDSFEQNTSPTDTVQREVSFTFFGKTATTTITQGVWIDKAIFVTTEGISDYGWVTADSKYNVDGYDVYMSNNQGVDNSQAVMKLECIGYTDLTLYIRSYAESYCDYTIASKVNVSNYPKAYNDSIAKAHTRVNQNSGTTLSDYTAVTYTGLSGNDTIYIVFTKDGSTANGDDRGYVLIPKQS